MVSIAQSNRLMRTRFYVARTPKHGIATSPLARDVGDVGVVGGLVGAQI
jgi:hypothetical protein